MKLMESLFSNLEGFEVSQKKRINSERADIISQFVDEINIERPCTYKDKNGKKITKGKVGGKEIAIKVGHLKDNGTLYFFLNQCKKYKLENKSHSFSKCFFGSLIVK